MEVAGTRHEGVTDLESIAIGDHIEVKPDHDNPVDFDALALTHQGTKIGYVNRALRQTFYGWMSHGQLTLIVVKKNGKPHRPLIYLRVSVVKAA